MNIQLTNQLKNAKDNLERLRQDFKDEPELLAVYGPSAEYLVKILQAKANEES